MFKKKKSSISLKPTKKFFSMLVIGIAVIMVWRGIWNLMDTYLFPDNWVLSNVLSLIVGIVILYLPDKDIKELV